MHLQLDERDARGSYSLKICRREGISPSRQRDGCSSHRASNRGRGFAAAAGAFRFSRTFYIGILEIFLSEFSLRDSAVRVTFSASFPPARRLPLRFLQIEIKKLRFIVFRNGYYTRRDRTETVHGCMYSILSFHINSHNLRVVRHKNNMHGRSWITGRSDLRPNCPVVVPTGGCDK